MLGNAGYVRNWLNRKELYTKNNLLASVLTTDETRGIKDEKIEEIIETIIKGEINTEDNSARLSDHHYYLV